MTDFKKLMEQYRNDAAFYHMVNALRNAIEQFQLSPSEVRGAAMLAVYLNELENPRPIKRGNAEGIP